MKKYLVLAAMLTFSTNLSAGSILAGEWYGKCVKNGQPMGFTLVLNENGNVFIAFETEPDKLATIGTWKLDGDKLSFKGSDEELQTLVVIRDHNDRITGRILEFQHKKGSLQYQSTQDWSAFLGFDKAATAVILSRK